MSTNSRGLSATPRAPLRSLKAAASSLTFGALAVSAVACLLLAVAAGVDGQDVENPIAPVLECYDLPGPDARRGLIPKCRGQNFKFGANLRSRESNKAIQLTFNNYPVAQPNETVVVKTAALFLRSTANLDSNFRPRPRDNPFDDDEDYDVSEPWRRRRFTPRIVVKERDCLNLNLPRDICVQKTEISLPMTVSYLVIDVSSFVQRWTADKTPRPRTLEVRVVEAHIRDYLADAACKHSPNKNSSDSTAIGESDGIRKEEDGVYYGTQMAINYVVLRGEARSSFKGCRLANSAFGWVQPPGEQSAAGK